MKTWTPENFRDEVILPGLLAIDCYSKAAERLVLATAMAESNLKHTRQIGGPALGYFQMEPRTHDDIWTRYLGPPRRQHLIAGLRKLSDRPGYADELEKNPQYAAAMTRIFYLRFREGLPPADDLEGMARYWKRYYNTALGKGTIKGFILKARGAMTV